MITFEQTPNPEAVKICLDGALNARAPQEYRGAEASHPLARALLGIDGIERVLIARSFATVVCPGRDWRTLKTDIAVAIADWMSADAVPPEPDPEPEAGVALGDIETQIVAVLDRYVRPLVAADGGDAVFERYDPEERTAWIRMDGACGGCPSGTTTLKRGIETTIIRWVPEVRHVKQAQRPPETRSDAKRRIRRWLAEKWGVQ